MASLRNIWLGREREVAELLQGIEDAVGGCGGVFLITGEPGIGKTRLSDEVARAAAARGLAVHWGRAWEAGGAPSYWPFVQILRGMCRGLAADKLAELVGPYGAELAQLLPELRQKLAGIDATATLERFQLFEAVDAFFHAAAARMPQLIVLDDLHAADPSSLQLLHFLVRDLRSRALLVVGTYRDAEVRLSPELGPPLMRIAREAFVLPLRRLDRDEVAAFVAQATGAAPDAAVAEALHQRTEGNPLFLRELLQLQSVSTRQPEGIREVVRARLALLSPAVRSVLEAAAVLGRESPLEPIAALAEAAELDVRALLAIAAEAAIVEPLDQPERWRFTHVLLREGLHDDLPASRRAALHRAAMTVLLRRVDPPLAEIAHHAVLAIPAVTADTAACAALRAAERAIHLFAFEDAFALLERTAKVIGDDVDERRRFEVLLQLGIARSFAGHLELGKDRCRQAAAIARGLGDGELFARAVLGEACEYIPGIRDNALIGRLEDALAMLPPTDGALRARCMVQLAAERQPEPDPAPPIELARAAVAMARRLGDPATLRFTLSVSGLVTIIFAPDAESVANTEEALRLALGAHDKIAITRAHLMLTSMYRTTGDIAASVTQLCAYEELVKLRHDRYQWTPLTLRAVMALAHGDFAASESWHRRAHAIWRTDEARGIELVAFPHGFARAAERYDDLSTTESALRAGFGALGQDLWTCVAEMFIAQLHARVGDRRRTAAQLATLRAMPVFAQLRAVIWLGLLAEPCHLVGDTELAARLYAEIAPHATNFHELGPFGTYLEPPYGRQLGLLAQTLGRLDDAVAHLTDAEARTERSGLRSHLARMRYELAGVLLARAAAGDRERAATLLASARRLAEELGQAALLPLLDLTTDLVTDLPSSERAGSASLPSAGPVTVAVAPEPVPAFALTREGDYFAVTWSGSTIRLRDSRGMQLLEQLVASPNQEVHVLQLAAGGDDVDGGDSGALLDPEAIQRYRRRLLDLREELEEAEDRADLGRAEKLREEVDMLTTELARPVGLGGRARRAGNAAERARTAVQKRVRDAIKRIAEGLPELGKHLDVAIRTGTFCGYLPEGRRR